MTDLMKPKDPFPATDWMNHGPGDDDAILDHLEQSIPVRLIATLGEFAAAFADECGGSGFLDSGIS